MIAVIVGVVFLTIIDRLLSETARLRHSEEVIAAAERIRELAVDMETGVRGYRLSRDSRFLEPYDRASRDIPPALVNLEVLVSDNPEQSRRALTIRQDVDAWRRFAGPIIDRPNVDVPQQLTGKILMDRIRLDSDRIIAIAIIVGVATIAGFILTMFIRRQFRDISNEYVTALTAAEQSAMAKDRLLAMVSHELRTPLTSILGWATMMRSRQIDVQSSALALVSIEQSARLLWRLIEELIDVSRAITG
jgi:signal transduction histidine kinase